MSLPATAAFSDGNGNTPANWTEHFNGIQCTSAETCRGDVGGDYNLASWNADSFNPDQYSKVVYKGGGFVGVAARVSGSGGARNGYYLLVARGGGPRLSKVVNGSITDLISPGGISDPSVNAVIEIRVQGSSISVYYGGVQ